MVWLLSKHGLMEEIGDKAIMNFWVPSENREFIYLLIFQR